MLVKTKLKQYDNAEMILPEVGLTQLSDGVAEVPDHVGELLLKQPNDWEKVKIEGEDEEEEGEDEEESEEGDDDKNDNAGAGNKEEGGNKSKDNMIKLIDTMEMADLIKLASEAKIKGYNLFLKDVSKMRNFMKRKIDSILAE